MSFASSAYLPFLGVVLALFLFVPARARPLFLLVASYSFYAQRHPLHGLLLAGSTALDYLVALGLGRAQAPGRRRALLALSLCGNLGALFVFKYGGFAAEGLNALLRPAGLGAVHWPALVLPLGISFYTFQTLAYTIDVYRRRIEPCRDPVELALYVSFFPQLVAGPIERAGRLLPQLRRTRPPDAALFSAGGRLLLWGCFKKLVLADNLRLHVEPVFGRPEAHGSLTLLLAAVAMNAMLFLDFSSYTDIARGSARLFGVELVENFRRPFLARSMNEFLARWHMSLTSWIADYVYSPLSAGPPSHARVWRNNLLTMALFGLWHGASWTFLVWGLGVGVAISLQHSWRLHRMRQGRRPARPGWGPRDWLACLATTLYASAFIVLFFSPTIGFTGRYLGRLVSCAGGSLGAWELGTLAFLLAGLATQALAEHTDLERLWRRIGPAGRAAWVLGLLLLLVLLRNPEPEDFIYFRF